MKILFYSNRLIEWSVTILITVNIIFAGLNYDDLINYPMNVLILTLVLILIGITFEIYKLDSYFEAEGKILAIAVIILVALSVISIFYIHEYLKHTIH